ncbi:hypothetical protein BVI1335_400078 [Burkholderia vietnamiensis]|nr:hypothetical protein BVI1335_400078 [Burkholderia vietnamiensis]
MQAGSNASARCCRSKARASCAVTDTRRSRRSRSEGVGSRATRRRGSIVATLAHCVRDARVRVEFRAMRREERPHVAHVRCAGEEAPRERIVFGDVGQIGHHDEIWPRRHAVALRDRRLRAHVGLERVVVFGRLPVEADLDQRGDGRADRDRIEHRDLPADHAGLRQPPHTAHAGRRRRQRALGQLQVRHRRVVLQDRENAQVEIVERDAGHRQLLARRMWNLISSSYRIAASFQDYANFEI